MSWIKRNAIAALALGWVLLWGTRQARAEDFSYWMNMAAESKESAADIEYYSNALAAWTEADGLAGKAKAYKLRGWAHYQTQAWAKVVEDETGSIALAGDDWETYHFRGWARYARKEFADAATDHARTVELHAGDPYLGFAVALCRMLEGFPQKSVEASQKSLEVDPTFAMSHANLGFAYLDLKDYAAAAASFQKAVELAGEGKAPDASAVLGLALVKWKQKQKKEAIAGLKEALKLQPDLDKVDIWMSMVRQYTPAQRQAIKDLRRAAKIKP